MEKRKYLTNFDKILQRSSQKNGCFFHCRKQVIQMEQKLQRLIDEGKADNFYQLAIWKQMREQVMKHDHYECQLCKAKGRYRKGVIVHHVKHLKDRPDLALSMWDGEERQLITVCKQCHEELHPESQRQYIASEPKGFVNEERWD